MLQAQTIAAQSDKRQRQFDKSIDDWKRKVTDLQSELEQAQRDSRDHAAEVYRQRSQMEDNNDIIESLKRENKNLAGINHRETYITCTNAAYLKVTPAPCLVTSRPLRKISPPIPAVPSLLSPSSVYPSPVDFEAAKNYDKNIGCVWCTQELQVLILINFPPLLAAPVSYAFPSNCWSAGP